MVKMSRCAKVEPTVKEILENIPETRSDDFRLLYEVYKKFLPDVENMYFRDVMKYHKELGLPYFESVRRTRPKLQRKYPEHMPPEEVQAAKEELKEDYRAYALRGE